MRRLNVHAKRMGFVMEPSGEMEAEGILNPGCARGKDGELYLFPRMVARGNYSRIGIARVEFDQQGSPRRAERLGIALEPAEDYEKTETGGGCEDPRVTYIESLDRYVMTYTALSQDGPRIAIAVSEDLFTWERLGLAKFHPFGSIDLGRLNNKDAAFFPTPITSLSAEPAMALIHRPLFPEADIELLRREGTGRRADLSKESIWVSFSHCSCDATRSLRDRCDGLCEFEQHLRIAGPEQCWEELKVGLGCPPVALGPEYLLVYHGVCHRSGDLVYSAGAKTIDGSNVHLLRSRSEDPFLTPSTDEERKGTVPHVVFPTGIDPVPGSPNEFDLYYGMADYRVGCCRITLQEW